MLNEYFGLSEKHTTFKIEIVAGLTTFLTMAYIVFVNPSVLSLEGIELTDIERMDKQALIAVTCLVSGLATIIVGIFAKAPIAMAPGMGLNAFFAYLVSSGKMDWQTALGVVFLSGLFFLILTLLGLRKRLVEAIPESLVSAIAVGIGLFITFMGLVKLGIVVSDEHTLVKAGPLDATVLIGLFGLLVMIFCEMKKIRGGLVAGIFASTLLAGLFGRIEMPERFISLDMNLRAVSLRLDILGALKWSFFGSIFTLMFIDMFDSVGTLVACCHQADMVDREGRIEGLDRRSYRDPVPADRPVCPGSRHSPGVRHGSRPDHGGPVHDEGSQTDRLHEYGGGIPCVHNHRNDSVELQHQHGACIRVCLVHTDQGGFRQGKRNKSRHVGHRGTVGTVPDTRSDTRYHRTLEISRIGGSTALKVIAAP